MPEPREVESLAGRLAGMFGEMAQVEAVALGGSLAGSAPDSLSDIDLYVYTRAEIPLEARQAVVARMGGASTANLGLTFWGHGDEWFDARTGIEIDVVYFDASWMEDQLDAVIHRSRASLGFTTCFWHTVSTSRALHDPRAWFARLHTLARRPYPEELRRGIIALNHPLLRSVIPAYSRQIEKALHREDLVSVNHRLAALFARYFDILFALNRELHPGEKRLLALALEACESLPEAMAADVTAVLRAGGEGGPGLLLHLHRMLDRLDALLDMQGFDPATSQPRA